MSKEARLSRRRVMPGVLVVLALTAAACGSGGGSKNGGLSGTVSADGSSTVFLITEAVAEEFKKGSPGVDVAVGESGTGGGFQKFCNGETDIADASRAIKDEEKAACTAKAIEFVELKIAKDGLSVVVNTSNTWADCLTAAELKKVWEPGSKVDNWNQVRSGFPDEPLKLYGPGTASGTFDFFTKEINGEEKATRTDYTASEDDNTLVQGVAGDAGAMGYFGYAYYAENTDKLKVLGVDGGAGCIKPSDETVKNETYAPLSRPLFIYLKKASLSRPEVKAFVDFYLSNINTLIGDIGYTPLPDADLAAAKAAVDTAAG